jgi:perosamine synthetase
VLKVIPFGLPMIGPEEKQAVAEVLNSPTLVHGPRARQFEENFSTWTGSPHAVSLASCTAGLHLAYFDLGIGAQDEVIVPAQTHTATAHAVELTGAKPVFVDCELETGNIAIDQIEAAISPRTKAISVVHYLGMPVAMDRICAIAKKHSLFVLEDCALSLGAYYRGMHTGLWGDAGCFSFYPVKHITTAEGGMLITKRTELAGRIKRKRAFGVDRTACERKVAGIYDVTMLGFNYRMNEIEAALGIEQLKRMKAFLTQRRRNYTVLHKALSEIDELNLFRSTHGDFESSYYCLSVILNAALRSRRTEIVESLNRQGVGTSVYYPRPVPHFTYYSDKYGYNEKAFPNASAVSYSSIALPVGPHLGEEDMFYITDAMKMALSEVAP